MKSSLKRYKEVKKEKNSVKRNFNLQMVKKAAAVFAALLIISIGYAGTSVIILKEAGPYTVEAKSKKDKKKPVIKFSGKSNITAVKGKSIKIPKTTAKDNKDGNVTKKLKVTVKKGKTNYSKIASAIKKNRNTKFSNTGKYVITYAVTDKAGNKATKKRYVTVVEQKKDVITTEEKTTEKVTTEIPTTEKITTETPTTEEPFVKKEYPIYEYNVVDSSNEEILNKIFNIQISNIDDIGSDVISFEMDNDYSLLYIYPNSPLLNNAEYLKYFGKIKAYDEYGNDISDNIVICESNNLKNRGPGCIYIYVEDNNGHNAVKSFLIKYIGVTTGKLETAENLMKVYEILEVENLAIGKLRYKKYDNSIFYNYYYAPNPSMDDFSKSTEMPTELKLKK